MGSAADIGRCLTRVQCAAPPTRSFPGRHSASVMSETPIDTDQQESGMPRVDAADAGRGAPLRRDLRIRRRRWTGTTDFGITATGLGADRSGPRAMFHDVPA